MTRVTQRTGILVRQHVSIRTSMWGMTRATALNSGRRVFEHEWSILVCVAGTALLMFETTKAHTGARRMGIVAGTTRY
jgi:hypothetical protein